MLSKKFVIGLTGAVLAAITSSASAEIKQAKRAIEPQISREDVVLVDVKNQDRMQSETFSTDAQTQKQSEKERIEKARKMNVDLGALY